MASHMWCCSSLLVTADTCICIFTNFVCKASKLDASSNPVSKASNLLCIHFSKHELNEALYLSQILSMTLLVPPFILCILSRFTACHQRLLSSTTITHSSLILALTTISPFLLRKVIFSANTIVAQEHQIQTIDQISWGFALRMMKTIKMTITVADKEMGIQVFCGV